MPEHPMVLRDLNQPTTDMQIKNCNRLYIHNQRCYQTVNMMIKSKVNLNNLLDQVVSGIVNLMTDG